MSRSSGQSEVRPSVFKSPSKLGTDLSTHYRFHAVACEQKKQQLSPANIPYSINSSANRRIFLKKKEMTSF
ncbi:hypothetical protein TNCV_1804531 [Trichonephila clavipes]|nr:hypothetical protein TNCV_1804531 [Trichonephila clavipes]